MIKRLWNWLMNPVKVEDRWGCPDCGERRADWLAWIEDGEAVRCESCGTVYTLEGV